MFQKTTFIGGGSHADRPGLLEYESAPALRMPLAGPAKFAAAFCCEAKCGVPAFGGWMLMSFALRRAAQPSVTPQCPTSPFVFRIRQGGRASGAVQDG
jgi:hypothetical protein